MGLTLDPQLIRDLTVLITSSTLGGMLMESLKQPVINGYFIAGSVVGPGGFKLIKVGAPQCTGVRVSRGCVGLPHNYAGSSLQVAELVAAKLVLWL